MSAIDNKKQKDVDGCHWDNSPSKSLCDGMYKIKQL